MWLPIVLVEIRKRMSAKPEVELIFAIAPTDLALMSNLKNLNLIYLENGDRYHDGVSGSRIRNHPWAIDWYHDL